MQPKCNPLETAKALTMASPPDNPNITSNNSTPSASFIDSGHKRTNFIGSIASATSISQIMITLEEIRNSIKAP
jgi:hypothetical protein